MSKIVQLGGFLGRLLGLLLKTGLSLMKNVLKLLAKSVLIPLGLTAAVAAIDAAIQKKILDSVIRYDYTNNLKWKNDWYHEN